MPRRPWDARTKALIVLQGLKGTPVSQLCTEHQISQAQYDDWRDQWLANVSKVFETHQQADQVARLTRENSQLTRHITNILTNFRHRITNAVTEGLTSTIQTIKKMARGLRNCEHFKTAIYFHGGGLHPDPC